MPITVKNDDILISFSYEYPMEGKSLKLDFSLFYKDDILSLRVKNGSKSLGIFPVTMFQEIISFLFSKGYIDHGVAKKDSLKIPENNDIDDMLLEMSSTFGDDAGNEEDHKVNSSQDMGGRPIQSFSVDYKSEDNIPKTPPSGSTEDLNKNSDKGEVVSFKRFRDDINYVEPGFSPDKKSNKSSSVKRS
tara:strand:+ start:76 stop:642 length:567 start_codon:yes stop_codon:yes gene_type:complete